MSDISGFKKQAAFQHLSIFRSPRFPKYDFVSEFRKVITVWIIIVAITRCDIKRIITSKAELPSSHSQLGSQLWSYILESCWLVVGSLGLGAFRGRSEGEGGTFQRVTIYMHKYQYFYKLYVQLNIYPVFQHHHLTYLLLNSIQAFPHLPYLVL